MLINTPDCKSVYPGSIPGVASKEALEKPILFEASNSASEKLDTFESRVRHFGVPDSCSPTPLSTCLEAGV